MRKLSALLTCVSITLSVTSLLIVWSDDKVVEHCSRIFEEQSK